MPSIVLYMDFPTIVTVTPHGSHFQPNLLIHFGKTYEHITPDQSYSETFSQAFSSLSVQTKEPCPYCVFNVKIVHSP